ncbi:hypothetical protein RvY_00565 [Ramazzottius varieornatus]|uniref:Methyltransferase type 11 domain-containing protein n=1 Tax=Ramazzottius varieornatus TaxID=947166 RepID=A0A1D1UD78_RAMVA|nr:hypothetical protein RvY_00565 [Ramazzottius varieornatus]
MHRTKLRKFVKLPWHWMVEVFECWWRICLIPLRILAESLLYFSSFPDALLPSETNKAYSPTARGDPKSALKDSVHFWWASSATSAVMQRKFAKQILQPVVVETYSKVVLGRDISDAFPSHTPLLGARILEVQCGAGFLTELLMEAGAEVTGIDTDASVILAARAHWQKRKGISGRPTYLNMSARVLLEQRVDSYDVVVVTEPLDQLKNWKDQLPVCAKLVRQGGALIVTSANRTPAGLIWNIVGLEQVLGCVSGRKAKRFRNFVKEKEVMAVFRETQLIPTMFSGIVPFGLRRQTIKWHQTVYHGTGFLVVAKSPEFY